jgi:transposase
MMEDGPLHQRALTEMNVQLHNVISDLAGVTGQAIVRAILKGQRDPVQLAGLRDRRIQAREEELVESLRGNWKEEVLFELQQAVDAYDFHRQQMAECDARLQQDMAA